MFDFINRIKEKAVYKKYPRIKGVINNVSTIVNLLRTNFTSSELRYYGLRKEANQFMEYQNKEQSISRNQDNDRHFPMETVRLNSHKLAHEAELDEARIHIGAAADEYARMYNALAITLGRDIYFRHGAYKPETEEGRKILAHELTHVSQYDEGRIKNTIPKKELELEAEEEEKFEEYDSDPLEAVEIGGETFYLRPSEHKEVIKNAIAMLKGWLEEQKVILDDDNYYRLLMNYVDWKNKMV